MFKRTIVAVCSAALIVPALAGSFDRQPVTMSQMRPDGWAATNATAQANMKGRYSGVKAVRCTGVSMSGYGSQSYAQKGNVVIWDKNSCSGSTRAGSQFNAVHDAKGSRSWTMYRLKGASIKELRASAPIQPVAPPIGGGGGGGGGCDPNYSGACVPQVPYDLDCADINGPVYVRGSDPHGFDGDGDGVGCES